MAGSRTGKHPRYPDLKIVRNFRWQALDKNIKSAIHLCGVYSRLINGGEFDEVLALCQDFDRVQINAKEYSLGFVVQFAARCPAQVITQWRGVDYPFGIEHLHDESGGRGIDTMKTWPSPEDGVHCGYAGGLSNKNISAAVTFARDYPFAFPWLDMESSVRTNDWFDLDKVRNVIEVAGKN